MAGRYLERPGDGFDVSVPAGIYRSQSVRENTTGAYTKFYFSDQVGFWTKQERYDSQSQKTGERVLTSHNYQTGFVGLLLIVGAIVVVAGIAIAAFAYRRRKRAWPPPPPQAPPPGP